MRRIIVSPETINMRKRLIAGLFLFISAMVTTPLKAICGVETISFGETKDGGKNCSTGGI